MEPIYSEDYKGYKIKIYPDEDVSNPRTDFDNLGVIAASHRRYSFDESKLRFDDYGSWSEVEKYLRKERGAVAVLPLYMYDHSGITIRTTPFNDQWDSGQLGLIYTTKELLEKMGVPLKNAKKQLEAEVNTLDMYVTGNVYGFVIEDSEGNQLDSVWGFFGDYDDKYSALTEARSVVNSYKGK
jgi:hypothetical protein